MKKILIIAVFFLLSINVSLAQKQYRYWNNSSSGFAKSEQGTWGLGFQTTVLSRSDLKWQYGLYAKYFVTDQWALRANMRFGCDYAKGTEPKYITSTEYEGNDWNSAPNDDGVESEKGTPTTVIRKSNFMLVVGAEHRQELSDRFSHCIYALFELLDSVATTHQTEHLIRAALNRDMEVMLKFR